MKKGGMLLAIFSMLFSQAMFSAQSYSHQLYLQKAITLYKSMTLDEKLGQLLLPTYRLLSTCLAQPKGREPGYRCKIAVKNGTQTQIMSECGLNDIARYHLGAVLQDGGPYYDEPSRQNWKKLNTLSASVHHQNQHDPLFLIGNDAIHGNSHVAGAVIFPHNINLGVTHDSALVKTIGMLTAADVLTTGFNWVYMPTVAIAYDLRWGRTYESFAQDSRLVKQLANAYITGFQQFHNNKIQGVLATAKHFMGDGDTQYGLDEGNDSFTGSLEKFWQLNGAGYEAALAAKALSTMVSYSAINGERMHFGGEWSLLQKFKQGMMLSNNTLLPFPGFFVSDYNGPTRAAFFYNQRHPTDTLTSLAHIFAKSINAGVDMIMLGNNAMHNPFNSSSGTYYHCVGDAVKALKEAYQKGYIQEARLQDAVTRILAVKLAMASQITLPPYAKLQEKQRSIALKAAEKSLVLLKNDTQLLPLVSPHIKNIVFIGDTDDVGIQNGGWTINWQGQKGNTYFSGENALSSGATTVERALHQKLNKTVHFYHKADIRNILERLSANDTVVVTVVAEVPYAEYMGDIANPHEVDHWYQKGIADQENLYMPKQQAKDLTLMWDESDASVIDALKSKHIPVITIVFSGRPVILTEGGRRAPLKNSDAVIAAFLPGTRGGDALARAILGDYRFRSDGLSNTLTFPWPRNMEDVVNHFQTGSLYPIGYGISTKKAIKVD